MILNQGSQNLIFADYRYLMGLTILIVIFLLVYKNSRLFISLSCAHISIQGYKKRLQAWISFL